MRQFKTYQHYKGGLYLRLCDAEHTETGEVLAIYVCAISGRTFCRPKAMFEENLSTPDYSGPRFILLPEGTGKEERKAVRFFEEKSKKKAHV